MKNKAVLYVLAVVILDVVAAVSVINSGVDPKRKEYRMAVAAAEEYTKDNLCSKAIHEYERACDLFDSSNIRLKIADLYQKGYENGEYASLAGEISTLDDIIVDYPYEADAYERLVEIYNDQLDYESCAKYVKLAKEKEIESDVIEDCYNTVKKIYAVNGSGYDSVESCGSYQVATRKVTDEIEQYNDNGEPILETDSEGNSYVKTEPRDYVEYTFYDHDGTVSDVYKCLNMSRPAVLTFEDKQEHLLYFYKNYGNDLDRMEASDKVYSSLQTDNVRQSYFGENNEYVAASDYSSGILTLYNEKTEKYDLFSTAGELLQGDYDFAGCFNDGVAYVEESGEKKIIDVSGKTKMDGFEEAVIKHGGRCSAGGRMFINNGSGGFEMYDTESAEKIDFICDNADLFVDWAAAFEKNGKWGFVDKDGKEVIEPAYEEAKSFSNGYAAVKKDGKWGFIDKSGDMIIEPQFDDALYFNGNKIAFVYDIEEGWKQVSVVYME